MDRQFDIRKSKFLRLLVIEYLKIYESRKSLK